MERKAIKTKVQQSSTFSTQDVVINMGGINVYLLWYFFIAD